MVKKEISSIPPKKPRIQLSVGKKNDNVEFIKLVNPDLQTDFAYILNTGSPPDYPHTLQVPGPTALNNQPPETC